MYPSAGFIGAHAREMGNVVLTGIPVEHVQYCQHFDTANE